MIDPKVLRPGNWIHRKGSSAYGIVNGKLLALLEEDEKERERFRQIRLNGDWMIAAGFEAIDVTGWVVNGATYWRLNDFVIIQTKDNIFRFEWGKPFKDSHSKATHFTYLDELQNLYLYLTGSELSLPESAKIIPQAVPK